MRQGYKFTFKCTSAFTCWDHILHVRIWGRSLNLQADIFISDYFFFTLLGPKPGSSSPATIRFTLYGYGQACSSYFIVLIWQFMFLACCIICYIKKKLGVLFVLVTKITTVLVITLNYCIICVHSFKKYFCFLNTSQLYEKTLTCIL